MCNLIKDHIKYNSNLEMTIKFCVSIHLIPISTMTLLKF